MNQPMQALIFLCAMLVADIAGAATADVKLREDNSAFTKHRNRRVKALENRGLVDNYTAKVATCLNVPDTISDVIAKFATRLT